MNSTIDVYESSIIGFFSNVYFNDDFCGLRELFNLWVSKIFGRNRLKWILTISIIYSSSPKIDTFCSCSKFEQIIHFLACQSLACQLLTVFSRFFDLKIGLFKFWEHEQSLFFLKLTEVKFDFPYDFAHDFAHMIDETEALIIGIKNIDQNVELEWKIFFYLITVWA